MCLVRGTGKRVTVSFSVSTIFSSFGFDFFIRLPPRPVSTSALLVVRDALSVARRAKQHPYSEGLKGIRCAAEEKVPDVAVESLSSRPAGH
jgi:hypothetical protein